MQQREGNDLSRKSICERVKQRLDKAEVLVRMTL